MHSTTFSVDVHRLQTGDENSTDGAITPRQLMYLRKQKLAEARALELKKAIGVSAEDKAIAEERKIKMWNGQLGSAIKANAVVCSILKARVSCIVLYQY